MDNMNMKENAAYLKGLFEGYDLPADDKSNALIGKMVDLMVSMAEKIDELEKANEDLREYIEEIDEDLGMVEDDLYEDDEYDEDDDDDIEGYQEIECPSCGQMVCFDASLDPDELVCPACGEKIEGVEFCDGNCENCSGCDDAEDMDELDKLDK